MLAAQPMVVLGDSYPLSGSHVVLVASSDDSGPGTLRQVLLDAKAGNTILFDPMVFTPAVPVTISLLSALPTIVADTVTIDGSEAWVVMDGSQLSEGDGLHISGSDRVIIRGLQILGFPNNGIRLDHGANHVIIGGSRSIGKGPLGQGNRLSGNHRAGIWIADLRTSGNVVIGNYIGTDSPGTNTLANLNAGVFIGFGASHNTIGGESQMTGNLVSGNYGDGIRLQGPTSDNVVIGNYIGTDSSGLSALGNGAFGINVSYGARNNVVGGNAVGARNLISGNRQGGIRLQSPETSGNLVIGNFIGTDALGTGALANRGSGVSVKYGASANVIGGSTPDARNLISGNDGSGVELLDSGTSGNQIIGNLIGIDVSGRYPLGNAMAGVHISRAARCAYNA